jgi:uncharacterized delta-60 repeat protein
MLALASAGGAATPPPTPTDDAAIAALLQPDGNLIALGSSAGRFALARYTPSGAPDRSFGDRGEVTTDLSPDAEDGILAAALERDGSIVAAGSSGSRAALVRYAPDGSVDPTFGDGGHVLVGCCRASAVAIEPDGAVVLAAQTRTGSRLLRLTADGAVDASFRVSVPSADIRALALGADGDVVAAGTRGDGAGESLIVTRFGADGSPDPSFGSGGTATAALPSGAAIDTVAPAPDGGVVVGGSVAGQPLLARYAPDGTPDPSLGDAGVAQLPSARGELSAVAVEPDGLVAAGPAGAGIGVDRLDRAGALDPAFGTGGTVEDARLQSAGAVVDEASRLVVVGAAGASGDADFALAAFRADGSPDTSFGDGGLVLTDFTPAVTASPDNPQGAGAHGAPRLAPRPAKGRSPHRRGSPHPVPAWYVNANNLAELKRFAAADACSFARSQPRSANRALLLDFGGARAYVNGEFGAAVNNASFTASNGQIRIALQVASDAYASCHRRGQATIAYAVTNHFKSRFASSRARAIGVHQARTVHRVWRYQRVHGYSPAERAGVAGDIETGYWGPKYSKQMANGAKATWTHGYLDFGTAGGCPPHPGLHYHGCFNGWELDDVAHVSNAGGGAPVPEIYYRGNPNHFDQAAQWASVARRWNSRHASGYRFAGTTGSTEFSGMAPGQSWVRMRRKAPGHVGRELLNFKQDHWVAKRASHG